MLGLFNSHLSLVDDIIVFLNILGAAYAIYWNFRADETGILFQTRVTVALMGIIYVIAYGILLFSEVTPGAWSSTLRMFALLSWYFVWSVPAKQSLKAQERLSHRLEKEIMRRMGIKDHEDGQ